MLGSHGGQVVDGPGVVDGSGVVDGPGVVEVVVVLTGGSVEPGVSGSHGGHGDTVVVDVEVVVVVSSQHLPGRLTVTSADW